MSRASAESLLVVDDDDAFRDRLVRAFRDRGYEAQGVPTAAEALRIAETDAPELAVVDLRIGADSGLHVVRALAQADLATRIVVLTGYGSIATAVEAMRLGATSYLTKPADADAILAALGSPTGEAAIAEKTPSLARAEWEHINRVLVDSGGNVSEAARRLGIHRRSLQRKLYKYPPSR